MSSFFMRPILIAAVVALLPIARAGAEAEYPKMGPDIYDVHADASVDIAAAVSKATLEHKRVILEFGANWCIWCRRLTSTFETNPEVAKALDQGFLVVRVDVNTRRGEKRNAATNVKYGNPIESGIPMLVVLDSDGKQLTTKDSGDLEEGEAHSPAKILAFLAAWAPKGRP